jgi:hypothetical protein
MNVTQALAFLLSTFALWFLFVRQSVCALCAGRGKHRPNCPHAKKNKDDTRD